MVDIKRDPLLESLILKQVQSLATFTSRDIFSKNPELKEYIIRSAIQGLKDDGKIFMFGEKRGAYYSIHPTGEKTIQEKTEIKKVTSNNITDLVFSFAKEKGKFRVSELFEKFPDQKEYILRQALQTLKDEFRLFMFGNRRGAYYSIDADADEPDEASVSSNVVITTLGIKDAIVDFSKKKNDWFTRKELTESLNIFSELDIKTALLELLDECTIVSKGQVRWTQYAFGGIENLDEEDDSNTEVSSETCSRIYDIIVNKKVVTLPQLIEITNLQRQVISKSLKILQEQEKIYHEGNKKSSKYILFDVDYTEVEDILEKQRKEISSKPIILPDALSKHLFTEEYVTITIKGNGNGFNFRTTKLGNLMFSKTFTDAKSSVDYLLSLLESK